MILYFLIMFAILAGSVYYIVDRLRSQRTTVVRSLSAPDTDAILNKLKNVSDEKTLLKACQKWSNPEIRDAIVPRLSRAGIVQLINGIEQSTTSDQEILRIFHSLGDERDQHFVLSGCVSGNVRLMLAKEMKNARLSRIENSEDQNWLASVVMNSEEAEDLRIKAIGQLTDQDRIANLTAHCMENKKGKAFLPLLIDRLTDFERIAELAVKCVLRKDETCLKELIGRTEDPMRLTESHAAKTLFLSELLWFKRFVRCSGRHKFFFNEYDLFDQPEQFALAMQTKHMGVIEQTSAAEVTMGKKEPMGVVYVFRCPYCGQRASRYKSLETHIWDIPQEECLRQVQLPEYRNICTSDSQQKLAQKVRSENEYMWLRVAAAEHIIDPQEILSLLAWNDGDARIEGLKDILIWQLPFDFDFESIVMDPSYPYNVRRAALGRIWDVETLDRIAKSYPYTPDEETKRNNKDSRLFSINNLGGEDGAISRGCYDQHRKAVNVQLWT